MNFGTLRCLLWVCHSETLDIFALVLVSVLLCKVCLVYLKWKCKWESKSTLSSVQVCRTPFLKHPGLLELSILLDWNLTLFFFSHPLPSCAEKLEEVEVEVCYIWTTLCGQKKHKLVITKELKRNFDEFGVLASLKFMNFKWFLFLLIFVSDFRDAAALPGWNCTWQFKISRECQPWG